MATGSGKTRTVIALCKALLEQGWAKDILFLADRNSLVTQAKRSFVNLLPEFSVTNLCEEKDNYTAHGVFSTYQTMMNCIDAVRDEEGKLFEKAGVSPDITLYSNGTLISRYSHAAGPSGDFMPYTLLKLSADGKKYEAVAAVDRSEEHTSELQSR